MSVEIDHYVELNVDQPSSSKINGNGDLNNYDTIFPSLPSSGTTLNNLLNGTESKLSIKRHLVTTQVFHVPLEERKYKEVNFGNDTNKKCEEIANKLGVKVEICCSKDQSMHVVISGPEEKVLEAKRSIINELQAERETKLKVPKEHHKILIGKSGTVLKDLQDKSCTKITVPKSDSNSEFITITGPKDGIELAIHEIQLRIDEQSKTSLERLNIPKLYHPWIRGFNNEIANEISSRTGAKINIPPPQIEKDEIVVSGERDKVDIAVNEIRKIYNAKSKLKIQKLAIEITKSQHKLIIGKNGSFVQDIFKEHDVYVQVPKLDSPSDTIYLYGEESKLGAALSQVCAKANSLITSKIEVPTWLHRHMIGEKGSNISKITADYPNTFVKFDPENKIIIDGPPDEVEKVRERLENISIGLKKIMLCEEVKIDPKYIPQIQSKLSKLNKEHTVNIRLPAESSGSNFVRIEGAHESVHKAKAEFQELIKRLENERSKDIIIEQKYHSSLIGKNGKNMNEIRAKFNDIQINIPSVEEKSDIITIRGSKEDVEKCYKYMQQLVKDMQESNYQEEMQIVKEFHRIIIGKQGAFIKKIRDDTHTRIEVPSESSDSSSITIIGKRENVQKARKLIEEKVKELINIKEDFVDIPHQFHTALIGKGGAIIKQLRKECGGVIINFPPENTPSDRITLKGPIDEIKKAKQELLKLAEQKNDLSYSEELNVKFEYHKFLVGRKGNNVNTLRDKYNVRILFPTSTSKANEDNNNNSANDIITIMGKQENVKAVRSELEASVKKLEELTTEEINVDPKWHKHFIARRAKVLDKISDDNCNVKISFPKANQSSDVVTIKGPKDAVESAKKSILEIVYQLENKVTIEVNVPQKYHVAIIGKKGANSQKISEEFDVEIQFPAKTDKGGDVSDIITISGLSEDCEKAKQAMLDLVPVVENFPFPKKFHKELLANKGEVLNELKEKYNVMVKLPQKEDEADHITLTGCREALDIAKVDLEKKLEEFELNNYTVEINNIKPYLLAQLRGFNGAEATKLENKYKVKIDFSKKGEPDRIRIKGLKNKVQEFENYVRELIQSDESKLSEEILIDNRIHPRLIGYQRKSLNKIKEKFKVDIIFIGRDSDAIIVKGDDQDSIDEAIDHLKNLEEEYLQDFIDKDKYTHPSSKGNDSNPNTQSKGFVVHGAPWEQQLSENPPDTTNMDDFPTISTTLNGSNGGQKMSWGPSRK